MPESTRTIDVLLKEVVDPTLRKRLVDAVNALRKQTRFGLVFEGHHPEVSRLLDAPIRKGGLVARRSEKGNVLYRVSSVVGRRAVCVPEELPKDAGEDMFAHALTIPVDDLVAARRFGDVIYPSLKLVDTVQRAPDKPWHVLIQADNYHALQALGYTHSGRVDLIYIDPPYNTGAKDWRYNNDYVDLNDPWRHSKWLSFMEKRLRLADKLMTPNGVLVVTIDEHEVHHLGCLLEQTFPALQRQLITIVINPKGVAQGRFSRVEENAIFCFRGEAMIGGVRDDLLTTMNGTPRGDKQPRWAGLIRSGTGARRSDRKTMFYPIIIDPKRGAVVGAGDICPYPKSPDINGSIGGLPIAWPIRRDGSEGRWSVGAETLRKLIGKGYVKLGRFDPARKTWGISYLSRKSQKQIKSGVIVIQGFDKIANTVKVEFAEARERQIKTVWYRSLHDAGAFGSDLLKNILGEGGRFPFPKSLYAVRDTLASVVRNNRNAVILDFFAGSGTTLHAVNLLNAADNGRRQCILITNNEVSEEDRKRLLKERHVEGEAEWDKHGICKAVTWPRCKYVVNGRRDNGTPLAGEYATATYHEREIGRAVVQLGFAEGASLDLAGRRDIARLIDGVTLGKVSATDAWHIEDGGRASILWDMSELIEWLDALAENPDVERVYIATKSKTTFKEAADRIRETLPPLLRESEVMRPMAAGFEENIAYFELGFLDSGDVARGQQFAAILPLLWMLTGAKAKCPQANRINNWLISSDCGFAVLHKEELFLDFRDKLTATDGIKHVFLVTDSEDTFKEMRAGLRKGVRTYMLYASYLRNFGINRRSTE